WGGRLEAGGPVVAGWEGSVSPGKAMHYGAYRLERWHGAAHRLERRCYWRGASPGRRCPSGHADPADECGEVRGLAVHEEADAEDLGGEPDAGVAAECGDGDAEEDFPGRGGRGGG